MKPKNQIKSLKNQNNKTLQSKKRIKIEIITILLLFLAAFLFVSTTFPGTTGWIGFWFVDFVCKNLFGKGVNFLPALIIILCFALLYNKSTLRSKVSAIGILIGSFALVIILEAYFKGAAKTLTWPIANNGGGIIGFIGLYILNKAIGLNGTWLFLCTLLLVSFVLIFNLSIKNIVKIILNTQKNKTQILAKENFKPKNKYLFNTKPTKTKINKNMIDSIEKIKKPELLAPPVTTSTNIDFKVHKKNSTHKTETKASNDLHYTFPPLSLLKEPTNITPVNFKEQKLQQEKQARLLEETLHSFQVDAVVVNITPGPSVTRYELKPGLGVKIAKITALAKDIALKLAATDIRIEAPIPGKALIGIEVPNSSVEMVSIRTIIEKTDFYTKNSKLISAIGLTITGEAILMDLAKMPHILIAGATGSGKSVCINSIILSILLRATPEEVKFLMIDPKKVELNLYEGIPHLVAPVVTDPNMAAATLKKWALLEMERRYEEFSKTGVKNIEGYNSKIEKQLEELEKNKDKSKKIDQFILPDSEKDQETFTPKKLPYIVVIIDELADLMMVASQEVEHTICRLAQMSRATGIHLVIATQRPSVNVITGLIKANVPSRISFFLQSQIDSRTILDMPGAEKLLGKGDMLYSPVGAFKPKRVQGVYLSELEIKNVVGHLKTQGTPTYVNEVLHIEPLEEKTNNKDNGDQDELFEEAKQIIINTKYASTSYLQRKLRIGYNRAARLMDELEEKGIISQYAGEKKPRSVMGSQ